MACSTDASQSAGRLGPSDPTPPWRLPPAPRPARRERECNIRGPLAHIATELAPPRPLGAFGRCRARLWWWAHDGRRPNGWLVLASHGRLHTSFGDGRGWWRLGDDGDLVVTFAARGHRLRLGQDRTSFCVVARWARASGSPRLSTPGPATRGTSHRTGGLEVERQLAWSPRLGLPLQQTISFRAPGRLPSSTPSASPELLPLEFGVEGMESEETGYSSHSSDGDDDLCFSDAASSPARLAGLDPPGARRAAGL